MTETNLAQPDPREVFLDFVSREAAMLKKPTPDPIIFHPRDGEPEDVTHEVRKRANAIRAKVLLG